MHSWWILPRFEPLQSRVTQKEWGKYAGQNKEELHIRNEYSCNGIAGVQEGQQLEADKDID